jgi:uncharacterized protein (TIGR02271 family)
MVVVDKNGLQGTIAQEDLQVSSRHGEVLVRFENGQQVIVPTALLIRDHDGSYRLPIPMQELLTEQGSHSFARTENLAEDAESVVIPVTEERLQVQKQLRETGVVEIRKTTHERTETVNVPLESQEVEIERVAVNRVVDQPVPIRYEGDTMIISLLEEVLVVEKRLVLREEVHVKKLSREVFDPQEVLLREERVEIARRAPNQAQADQG